MDIYWTVLSVLYEYCSLFGFFFIFVPHFKFFLQPYATKNWTFYFILLNLLFASRIRISYNWAHNSAKNRTGYTSPNSDIHFNLNLSLFQAVEREMEQKAQESDQLDLQNPVTIDSRWLAYFGLKIKYFCCALVKIQWSRVGPASTVLIC